MTEHEWVKRYVARLMARGSALTANEAEMQAEAGCRATDEIGLADPSEWEAPETIADEHIESELNLTATDPDLLTAYTLDGQAWYVVNGYGQDQAGTLASAEAAASYIEATGSRLPAPHDVVIVDVDFALGRLRVLKGEKGYSIEVLGLVRHEGLSAEDAITCVAMHMSNMPQSEMLSRAAFANTPSP